MINKKDTWNKLYENSKLKDIENRINLGLKDKKNLVIYYPWLNLIIKNRLKFKRSLEVGSGTGSYSLILKKLGLVEEVYLFDWSEESLKLAKKLFEHYGEKAHFIQGDAKNLPFKDNFFDLTLSGGLLEHFSREDGLKILAEKARASKYVLTQVPISTPAYWALRSVVTLKNFGWPFGYEKPYPKKEIIHNYDKTKIKIMDIMYHDVLTAVKYNLNSKGYKFNLNKKSINKLFINEIAILGKKIS